MYEEREGEKRRKRERDREVFVLKFVSKFVSEISLRYIHIARKREKEEVVNSTLDCRSAVWQGSLLCNCEFDHLLQSLLSDGAR